MGCHYLPQGPGPENGEIDSEAAKKGLLNIPVLDSLNVRIGSRGEFDQTVSGRSDLLCEVASDSALKEGLPSPTVPMNFFDAIGSFERARRF